MDSFVGVGGATVRGEGGKEEAETSSKKWLTPREKRKLFHPYSDKFVVRNENHFLLINIFCPHQKLESGKIF
jgi:hypothetical protein